MARIQAESGRKALNVNPGFTRHIVGMDSEEGRKTLNALFAHAMRALRKGQAEMFALQGGIVGEARIVERAFGVGPCVLTEAMEWLQDRLASAQT